MLLTQLQTESFPKSRLHRRVGDWRISDLQPILNHTRRGLGENRVVWEAESRILIVTLVLLVFPISDGSAFTNN